jgi:hypothetical protein
MTVQEIQVAITQLTPEELEKLAEWFDQFQNDAWDREIEQDVKMGRFDAVIQEVKNDCVAGRIKPM